MNSFDSTLMLVKEWIWGPPLLILFFCTGIYLTILLKGVQFRYLGFAIKQVFSKKKKGSKGDISHFEALMTSLAGAIGTGNIVGIATAVTIGGFGSIFWMWITALVSMATKFGESLLAVKYRKQDAKGQMIGGPMEYMEHGLGSKKLAVLFAGLGSFAALGIGNLVQVNSMVEAMGRFGSFDPLLLGVVIALITGLVIIGGVKSIGQVTGILVPFMALFYVGGGLLILLLHYEQIPAAFVLIFKSAFQGQAALGGFAGAGVMMAVQMGVARSVFTSESGLGISSIAAAAAQTDSPTRQGLITMTGALVSTVIICTITGLVIAVTGVFGDTGPNGEMLNGATLAIESFDRAIVGGKYIVVIGLILFSFSTIVAWAYYGEKCYEYLFGDRGLVAYRIFYTLIVIPAAIMNLHTAWFLADIANGLMAFPNLIALIMLAGVISRETRSFLRDEFTPSVA